MLSSDHLSPPGQEFHQGAAKQTEPRTVRVHVARKNNGNMKNPRVGDLLSKLVYIEMEPSQPCWKGGSPTPKKDVFVFLVWAFVCKGYKPSFRLIHCSEAFAPIGASYPVLMALCSFLVAVFPVCGIFARASYQSSWASYTVVVLNSSLLELCTQVFGA